MSHELIIIDLLLSIPTLTGKERECLQGVKQRSEKSGKCSAKDARKAATIVQRVLLSE